MKHTLLAVGILAAFALTSCKDEKASELFTDAEKQEQAESVVDPATAAVLTFESETYDFGNLPAAAKVDHYFKFTNTGKSPLIIKDAKGSCGCTVPEFPSTPIAVGATDSIKVVYTAGNMNGKQQKTVTLVTNTVNGHEKFDISANVVGATANDQNAQQAFGQ